MWQFQGDRFNKLSLIVPRFWTKILWIKYSHFCFCLLAETTCWFTIRKLISCTCALPSSSAHASQVYGASRRIRTRVHYTCSRRWMWWRCLAVTRRSSTCCHGRCFRDHSFPSGWVHCQVYPNLGISWFSDTLFLSLFLDAVSRLYIIARNKNKLKSKHKMTTWSSLSD